MQDLRENGAAAGMTPARLAMQDALIRLYASEDIRNLSVTAFCRRVPVARTTFYTYYSNLDDLLVEVEDRYLAQLRALNDDLAAEDPAQFSDGDYLRRTLDYLSRNRALFYALLVQQPNVRFLEQWKEAIRCHFRSLLFRDHHSENEAMVLDVAANVAIGTYTFWLKNPHEFDIARFDALLASVLRMNQLM